MELHSDSGFYRITVHHYLHPHLIWVEVLNHNVSQDRFEQIGVYGVVPSDMSVNCDGTELGLSSHQCKEWQPAASALMNKYLTDTSEIWFRPKHVDNRTSIFDSNIHKYGEIIVKRATGKYKKLSKLLTKTGFATNDENLFYQYLCSGILKTKLSNNETKEIIKQIEKSVLKTAEKSKCQEKTLNNQLTVAHAAEQIESMLTVQNLEHHNKLLGKISKAHHDLLQTKLNDLSLWKDTEENSLGRASTSKVIVKSPQSEQSTCPSAILQRKLHLKKSIDRNNVISEILCNKPAVSPCNKTAESSPDVPNIPKNSNLSERLELQKKVRKSLGNQVEKGIPITLGAKRIIDKTVIKQQDNQLSDSVSPSQICDNFVKDDPSPNKPQKSLKEKQLMSVAYGPPELDLKTLPIKKIARDLVLKNECFDEEIDVKESKVVTNAINNFDSDKTNVSSDTEIRLISSINIDKDVLSTSSNVINDSPKNLISNYEINKIKPKDFLESDDENLEELVKNLNLQDNSGQKLIDEDNKIIPNKDKNYVNPFKNLDSNISVFVNKIVTPVLMVHSKMNKRLQPCFSMRDFNFTSHIQIVLKNLRVEQPMTIQKISWSTILRGYSTFMVSPVNSGKTLGYIPAVCRLISDFDSKIVDSVGPTCIIVCATSESVSDVERLCRRFLGLKEKVFSCYAGMDERNITISLLNGCDLFVCTPSVLVRLLQLTEFGVDLRRLATLVLDDCERLAEVYSNEIKFLLYKVKEIQKSRVNKELKVQYVLASRRWCDFMEPLAKKAPNTVICIGAFQECVLYSKSNMSVRFIKSEKKIAEVLEFLKQIDTTKKSVIVCRTDEEVTRLEKVLTSNKHIVFASNSTMDVQELYNLNLAWNDFKEPVLGPVLVCRDENLVHLNVTDAHNLLHYSLPSLFSVFSKRFSVLNENYASIFETAKEDVKIKILLEETNEEQLPKILNFIKRCTNNVPEFLNKVSEKILKEKDVINGKKLVPVCDNLLAFGECPDFWNCNNRHTILKYLDEPNEWVPKVGTITFKILHYQSAVFYSVRLLSHIDINTKKYPSRAYETLCLKIGTYYSKESNRRLHGIPKVGDACAVSLTLSHFARCQVVKIINYYPNGNPNHVLIKMIDEEIWETTRDIYLYYLPHDLKNIETHVVQVRLANIQPKDRDITYSKLAREELREITDKEQGLYMRGHIVLTVGNCIFIDTLEACQDLSALGETVVRYNFKEQLLEGHAIPNPEHIDKIIKLCQDSGLKVKHEKIRLSTKLITNDLHYKVQWAHLEKTDFSLVYFSSAISPSQFYVRLAKFEDCLILLLKDITKYIQENNLTPISNMALGDFVLAKFPGDNLFERARIDGIVNNNVKCFFVDQGDWQEVNKDNILPITEKLVTQLPFQAIECRLIGVKPIGEEWSEFCTNWFSDICAKDGGGNIKSLYVNYFAKEKAESTGGNKYSVALIGTTEDEDVIINLAMIHKYLAQEVSYETMHLIKIKSLIIEKDKTKNNDIEEDDTAQNDSTENYEIIEKVEIVQPNINNLLFPKPLRSVPQVDSDESDLSEKWDTNFAQDFLPLVKGQTQNLQPLTNAALMPSKTITALPEPEESIKSVTDTSSLKSSFELVPSPRYNRDSEDFSSSFTTSDDSITPKMEKVKIESEISVLQTRLKNILAKRSLDKIANETGVENSASTPPKSPTKPLRRPKIFWHQNKQLVSMKIQLVVAHYIISMTERRLTFSAVANEDKYTFDLETYGIVNVDKSSHCNKGQYVLVKLVKKLEINWLSLAMGGRDQKWIMRDFDAIDTSSDEETPVDKTLLDIIRHNRDEDDSGSDDDFRDDTNFEYKTDS